MSAASSKYCVGDSVVVKIGDRPEIAFKITAVIHREKPYYQFDWVEHGYPPQLNTVHIPETSILHAAHC